MTIDQPVGGDAVQRPPGQRDDWLSGGGEMGALMRATDWSQTKLGPVDAWPSSLKTMLGVLLGSRFPMLIWWGPDLLSILSNKRNTRIRKYITQVHD